MIEKQEAVFRSAEMRLIEMFIPQEIARNTVYILGESGLLQFRDLNKKVRSFQRTFVSELRRLDNVERQYRYFYSLLRKYKIPFYEEVQDGTQVRDIRAGFDLPPSTSVIDDHVENAQLLEDRFVQLVEASEQLESQKTQLDEFKALLLASGEFFENCGVDIQVASTNAGEQDGELEDGASSKFLPYFTGVIPRDKVSTLVKTLWRMVRGNLYFRNVELPTKFYDAKSKEYIYKDAFIVFAHGDLIMKRIKKIAESLDANLYDIQNSQELRSRQIVELNEKLDDFEKVMHTTAVTLESGLYSISKELADWNKQICKEKAVYNTLNLFVYNSSRRTLTAEGWIPVDELETLQVILQKLTAALGVDASPLINVLDTNLTPPTFHRTNKFTKAFQDICDCYGIASYQEVNPGLATIVTFPFMFAIMFGDMGHGMILALAASVLVLYEKNISKLKRDEIFDMAFSGRYILLLMGLFSIYTGLIYNDMFSKSLTLFKSGWKWPDSFEPGESITAEQVGVYPIGIDYAWHGAENALLFSNALKMKLSIIMGFIHMFYSYMYSLANALYFKDMVDIVCNFIPGLLFFGSIFAYLVICIIYKWTVDWYKHGISPPALLNMFINMFLAPGKVDEKLYPGQAQVQVFLLFTALICVPWLLLAKPLHFKFVRSKHMHTALSNSEFAQIDQSVDQVLNNASDDETVDDNYDDEEEGNSHQNESFGDVVIHQVIHTIEWCLNCVSHTASYLRLWALSLAHAQLSTVLWTMTIQIAFGSTGIFGVFMTVALFAMWFILTCVILVVMEGTSAMLHSLRLHWVESMSKFFKGEGTIYSPFSFPPIYLEDAV
ncbi:HBL316Wp [Eremothecium sinecaudum]|uniref:V-type proton ATPase subunit a n=1 Tax=Eremothecium sinecaudum TaxID=45286 RepID=A0A120K0R6_9SACH|nr:HBL316Wp [Eremothecium sinecaudum]AMD18586.1 HBL316Wp [Eremothecium sinecaudum]